MAGRVTVDTNVLLYAIDTSEGAKHALARWLLVKLATAQPPLMLQCLHEFSSVALRKKLATVDEVREVLHVAERAFNLVAPDLHDLYIALDARERHKVAFWDALLWAGIQRVGATVLLTEDFQDGQQLGGVRFIDPFKLTKRQLTALLA